MILEVRSIDNDPVHVNTEKVVAMATGQTRYGSACWEVYLEGIDPLAITPESGLQLLQVMKGYRPTDKVEGVPA